MLRISARWLERHGHPQTLCKSGGIEDEKIFFEKTQNMNSQPPNALSPVRFRQKMTKLERVGFPPI